MNWKEELRTLPAPEPPGDLLARILASRAQGVRVVLPTVSRAPTAWSFGAVAATVALLLLGWLAIGIVIPTDGGGERKTAVREGPDFLARTPLFPQVGYAQTVSDTLGRARYGLLGRVHEVRLTPGSWSYAAKLTVDGAVTTPQGTRRFDIAAGTFRDQGVWIITTEGKGQYARAPFMDTLIVAQRDLRLLRLRTTFGLPGVWDSSHDSATRVLSWQYVDVGWLGSLYRALFQLEPIDGAWRGSVYLPWRSGTHGERLAYYPLDLHVDGEERVTVPAGTTLCFRYLGEGMAWFDDADATPCEHGGSVTV
jgi:hypothetical protein